MSETDYLAEQGVIYAATGGTFLEMAVSSAKSVRQHHPSVSISIFTDRAAHDGLDADVSVFDDIIYISEPKYNWNDKIYAIQNTPYRNTLYLDADTILVRSCLEQIFETLEYYPLLVRGKMGLNFDWEHEEYPKCIPQPNTGVIGYKRTPKVEQFLTKWNELRKKRPEGHDQPTFREALIVSKVPYSDIYPAYNYHSGGVQITQNKIRIIHDVQDIITGQNRERVVKKILGVSGPSLTAKGEILINNQEIQRRSLLKLYYRSLLKSYVYGTLPHRAVKSIHNDGFVSTVNKGVRKVARSLSS